MRKNKIKICCMMLIMTITLLGNISLYVEEVVAVDTSIKDVIHRADEIGWKYKKLEKNGIKGYIIIQKVLGGGVDSSIV